MNPHFTFVTMNCFVIIQNSTIAWAAFNFAVFANTLDSEECKDSKFIFPSAGHVVTGNSKIIPNYRFLNILSKCPKYRFPSHNDLNRCREEIASALNDVGNRSCKLERVECNA